MAVRSARFCLLLLLAANSLQCASEQTEIPGAACVVNSDCNAPLSCTYGLCHEACRQNGDCPAGQRCVWSTGPTRRTRVCLLAAQASCALNSQCTPDLVCGRDLQCRNECNEDRDCADDEDRCLSAGRNGEMLCVDPAAIVDGQIIDRTGLQAADAGPTDAPDGDAGLAIDGASDLGVTGSDALRAASEVEPNDRFAEANPFAAGSALRGCICNRSDVDWYNLSVPTADTAGGHFAISLTEVGDGAIFVDLINAADRSVLSRQQTLVRGQSHHLYLAGAAGQSYQLKVQRAGLSDYAPFDYTLRADYRPIEDPFEANDTPDQPAPLALGTTIEAYFFAGFRRGSVDAAEYEDWFAVDLAAGSAAVDVEDIPTNLLLRVRIYDEAFTQLAVSGGAAPNVGAEVHGSFSVSTPGPYRLLIQSQGALPRPAGAGEVPPPHFSKPYRLTVRQ